MSKSTNPDAATLPAANDSESGDLEIAREKQLPRLSTPNYILLLAAALLPRLMALGRYVTPDELFWVERSIGMRAALLNGNWAETIQSGHPGVTTSWLGALGIQIQLWLQPAQAPNLDWLQTLYWLTPDNAAAFKRLSIFLSSGRLLVILLTSLGILLIYRLAQPLFGERVALIGALLLALDPFTAGLSGLLHLDALLATFCLLAVLALLPGQTFDSRYPLFSGTMTGLAILTKTPGIVLLLFIPLLLLWRVVVMPETAARGSLSWSQFGRGLLFWLMGVLSSLLLLLPALWADPQGVYEVVAGLSGRLLEESVRPIYFLGQYSDNPGPIFYPLAVFLRLSPVTTIGLGLLAFAGLRALPRWRQNKFQLSLKVHNVLLLLGFSLAFLLMLTLAAKKFDRYALPAIMPLLLCAGVGFIWLGERWSRFKTLAEAYAALVATAQFIFLVTVLPFPLAGYNWFGGGIIVAKNVMTIGWGEATSVAAADLGRGLPAGATLPTLYSDNVAAAAPFYRGPVQLLSENNLRFARNGDSILIEAASWQNEEPATISERQASQFWPLRGLEARRYQVDGITPLPRQLIGWSFDQSVTVPQVSLSGAAWPGKIPIALTVTLSEPADYQLLLELRDQLGYSWVSFEQPLLNESDQPGSSWLADLPYRLRFDLAFPSTLPPGQYTVSATLFKDGSRLGVFDASDQFAGVVLPLATIPISAPTGDAFVDIPNLITVEDQPDLAGFVLPSLLDNGSGLTLDIWWRASNVAGQMALFIGEQQVTTPFSPPTTPAGRLYQLRPSWQLPIELEAGQQTLALQLLDTDGAPIWDEPFLLGEVEVRQRERLFELPAGVNPLGYQLGELAWLQSANFQLEVDTVLIEIIWQARGPIDQNYFHFVHLRDETGFIVAQSDRPPIEPTEFWVSGQYIVDRIVLDRPVAGDYTIALGLYDPETGVRPRLYDRFGASLSEDQIDQYILQLAVP